MRGRLLALTFSDIGQIRFRLAFLGNRLNLRPDSWTFAKLPTVASALGLTRFAQQSAGPERGLAFSAIKEKKPGR
jgi:hypothetical protein